MLSKFLNSKNGKTMNRALAFMLVFTLTFANYMLIGMYFAESSISYAKEEKEVIAQIDGAKVREDLRIETEYGIGTIRNLSSGCKTYLNIVKNPQKVVCADECGKNVLDIIFQLDEIKIYMDKPERFHINKNTKIRSDRDSQAGGKHDPKKMVSEPNPSAQQQKKSITKQAPAKQAPAKQTPKVAQKQTQKQDVEKAQDQ